jgi:hypothetical protein
MYFTPHSLQKMYEKERKIDTVDFLVISLSLLEARIHSWHKSKAV